MFEVRFKINKTDYEVIGSYPTQPLAYGMRKKFAREQPETYPLSKLYVQKV